MQQPATMSDSRSKVPDSTVTAVEPDAEATTTSSWRAIPGRCSWMPARCRYHPDRKFGFSLPLNFLFGLASTITAANMYYAYPVLNKLADDFGITYERASLVPTLLQAGYGSGILLLCPLGDSVRLRPFIISLVATTTALWIGLCITQDFHAFCALSFVVGFTTVTPQLMMPLAGALAPPARKARAISIVFGGLMLGTVFPRVISGIVAEYTDWRIVYWAGLGLQCLLIGLLWLFFPDYPSNDAGGAGYLKLLWTTVRLAVTTPILAYGCINTVLSNVAHAAFWTTLTAQLAASPFDFSPIQIGLFSILALAGVLLIPLWGTVVVERFAITLAAGIPLTVTIACVAIGSFTGDYTIAGLVIQALGIDFGIDSASIAYRNEIYSAAPHARNRANVAYTSCSFIGQLIGTSVGNVIYARKGWSGTGEASMGFVAGALVLVFLRGPHEKRWVGWTGGFGFRKKRVEEVDSSAVEMSHT